MILGDLHLDTGHPRRTERRRKKGEALGAFRNGKEEMVRKGEMRH